MRQLIEFIARFRDYITLVFLVTISLSLIYFGNVSKIGGYRTIVVGSIGWVQELFAWIPNPSALRSENNSLRKLNLYLSSEYVKSRTALLQNAKLKDQLEFKKIDDKELISAEVVGRPTIELRSYLSVNLGENDGILPGMTVRTDAGLVGSIIVADKDFSLIEQINNRTVKVSAKILRTAIHGILVWGGQNDFLLTHIPESFDVIAGDELITSNHSNKYPKYIPIGRVISVEKDESSPFHKIIVRPNVDFHSVEEVFIVKEIPDTNRQKLINELEHSIRARNKK